MRRRPEEDDEEEEERRDRQVASRSGPADERGHGSGRSADDDVLRGRALEPACVDEDVEEAAGESEERREDVDEAREDDEGERREGEPELERTLGRDPASRHGPLVGAAHVYVDVAVEHVIQRARPSTGEREPRHRGDEEAARRRSLRSDEHPARRGQQEEHHDARLRQGEVVAP